MYTYSPYPGSLRRAIVAVNSGIPKLCFTRVGEQLHNGPFVAIRPWGDRKAFVPSWYRDPISAIARWIDSTPINADGFTVYETNGGWELELVEFSFPLVSVWGNPVWKDDDWRRWEWSNAFVRAA